MNFLGSNLFFCQYLLTLRYLILFIRTSSAKHHNAKFYPGYKISSPLIFKVQNYLSNVSSPEVKHCSQYRENLIFTHQISLLCCNSFLIRLQTFQPTLVFVVIVIKPEMGRKRSLHKLTSKNVCLRCLAGSKRRTNA